MRIITLATYIYIGVSTRENCKLQRLRSVNKYKFIYRQRRDSLRVPIIFVPWYPKNKASIFAQYFKATKPRQWLINSDRHIGQLNLKETLILLL